MSSVAEVQGFVVPVGAPDCVVVPAVALVGTVALILVVDSHPNACGPGSDRFRDWRCCFRNRSTRTVFLPGLGNLSLRTGMDSSIPSASNETSS
jgi:hypothetical protein